MTHRDIPTEPLSALPGPLGDLKRLAHNMYWAWNPKAREVLRSIDPAKFDSGMSPVRMIVESDRLDELAADARFVASLDKAVAGLDSYLGAKPARHKGMSHDNPVAYFCAEYGIHESYAQYSGGLGILAGDHCKEASDMRMPFVAVGLFYQLGFFRQLLDPAGVQIEAYPSADPNLLPLRKVQDPATGEPLLVSVEFPGRQVHACVWLMEIGRVPLLLLDANVPENDPADRAITAQLYNAGRSIRFHQEVVLGVGGMKVLRALDIEPSLFHMNEGHSAMLLVERLTEAMAAGASFDEAAAGLVDSSIVTIHTPVPGGNERFDASLVSDVLTPMLSGAGADVDTVVKLGRDSEDNPDVFDMTAFALRLSRQANGVSLLHGETADKTWRRVVGMPVGAVTNGVHMPTWLGPEMREVFGKAGARFDRATGLKTVDHDDARSTWEAVSEISDEVLWNAHLAQKQRLCDLVSERLMRQHTRYGDSPDGLRRIEGILDPDAMIIGFARRFTGYKRPDLVLSDLRKLSKIVDDPKRPVQIVFAGKAHPLDIEGKDIIAKVYEASQSDELCGKIIYLEDYDIAVGRALVQGVDLWINNPLRPLEASGTSGMKAAANGVPNASILDGWWDEACISSGKGQNGFEIGARKPRRTRSAQDRFDANEIYRVLSEEVVPLYWKRRNRRSAGWIRVMRRSIATSVDAFSTRRMLEDYRDTMYHDGATF
ncbi:MAG: glycosyltransferase family 1 protein [Actinomycetia bacterium]|nr:glycosyltransferase family 1 protein [Actinomycetes bacterium]MCP4961513.1 glycosyltransferase family 1 protein [Actinomycetes bacterium]